MKLVPNMIMKQEAFYDGVTYNDKAKLLKAPLTVKCQPDNAEREKANAGKKMSK